MGITMSSNNLSIIPIVSEHETEHHKTIIYFKVEKNTNQFIEVSREEYLSSTIYANPGYLYSYVYPESYIIQVCETYSENERIISMSGPINSSNINEKYSELVDEIIGIVSTQPTEIAQWNIKECMSLLDIDYGSDTTSQQFKDKMLMFLKLLGVKEDSINTEATYDIYAFEYDYCTTSIEYAKESMRYNNDSITNNGSVIGKVVE